MSAALRAKSLVERILAFSRSGAGERVRINVQSVVDEALVATAASLPPAGALERDLSAGDAAVLGDATQIHQVVMNLCTNAVQAMRAGGTLGVTLQTAHLAEARRVSTTQLAPGDYITLAVRDTGTGIAPQVLERIFDPSSPPRPRHRHRARAVAGARHRRRPGRRHRCRQPSRRRQRIHRLSAVARQRAGAEAQASRSPRQRRDHPADRRRGNAGTAGRGDDGRAGYEPVGFASSAAALESLRDTPHRFDAVLSDEAMPEMTGSELAREIRRIRPDIPIVLMSGYVTPALIDRAREIGIKDVLAKPLAARDIARSLADALHD
jgi:CheY-like chemotaxis protein